MSVVDETTRSFVESISSFRSEFYFEAVQIDSNLIGSVIDQSSLCKPVSGTVKITRSTNETSNGDVETETTVVSQEADEPNWTVSVVLNDDETTRSEYSARTLTALPFQVGSLENSGADFICDFVDW